MNVDKLTPAPQDKVQFNLSVYYKVPEESGCYVLTNYDGDILYIGQAKNIHERFMQHAKNPDKTGVTPKGRAFWFHWLLWDEVKLNALERGWIHSYQVMIGELPIMNSIGAPV